MTEDPNLAKSTQFRVFAQYQGSSPANGYVYIGCLSLGGFQGDEGTGEPIYCPSSEAAGKYDIVGTTSPPPALPTTDFTQHMDRRLNDFWWDLKRRGCHFNLAVKGFNCGRPDDPDTFDAKLLVSGAKLTAFNTGAFNSLGEDAVVDLTGSLQLLDFQPFRPMTFGEVADSTVLAEALDGMYADAIQCGNCGAPSDGCQKMYVLTLANAGSPGLSSQIAYSINGGGLWATDDINTLGGLSGNRLAQVGSRVVVVSQADGAHHYKLQASIDAGVVGGWTRVSSGYVSTKGPRAIWSKSPSATYVAAAGGYVYFMANPTAAVTVLADGSATAQDLNDIRGIGRTIVAAGNNNALLVSRNDGQTWSAVTGPAIGIALNTLDLVTENVWHVGAANGQSYFTIDAGTSWTEMTPDASISAVNRIRFVDEIVGYMAVQVGGGSRIYRTADNGYSWHFEGDYVGGVPTAERYNFIVPCPGNYNVALAGGRVSSGGDGVVAEGVG